MRVRLYTVKERSGGKVSIMARPRGGDWLEDEIKSLHKSGVAILVSLLTASEVHEFELTEEAACCQARDITYLNLPIVDHSVPPFSGETFSFLEQLRAPLAERKHIAFHCRQGLGRSVMMAACLLVLAGFTPDEACEQLSFARGYEVPETEEQRAWVEAFSQARSRGSE